jgi:pimeloyl-ACP methyl ester carboxylesterase
MARPRRVLRWAAFAFASLAVVAVAALAVGAPVPIVDRFVLFPRSVPMSEWRTHPEFTPFAVAAQDGTPLRGWIVRGRNANAPWTILCTGNAGTVKGMIGVGIWFAEHTGANALVWDYRGFGFSGGRPDIAATRDDALVVYDAVRGRSGHIPIVYGQSFGTTIAAHIAHERSVRALVLHAAPVSIEQLFSDLRDRNFPWVFHRLRPWPARDVREDFAVAETVRGVRAPTLVIHGTADGLIPIAEGRLVERASGARVKRFIALTGVAHDRIDYATPEGAGVAAFLAAI